MINSTNPVSTGTTLLTVMRKQGFQLADAVHSFMNDKLKINDDAITEVLNTIPEQQQVFSNVVFLKNLVDNKPLFEKLTKVSFKKKEDESLHDAELRATTKTISTFKGLEKLRETITLADYAQFIQATDESIIALQNEVETDVEVEVDEIDLPE